MSLLAELESLQKNGEMTDTVLVGVDGSVPVHSLVLVQYSTFWNNIISQAKGDVKTVLLPQYGLAELRIFVENMYSSKISKLAKLLYLISHFEL